MQHGGVVEETRRNVRTRPGSALPVPAPDHPSTRESDLRTIARPWWRRATRCRRASGCERPGGDGPIEARGVDRRRPTGIARDDASPARARGRPAGTSWIQRRLPTFSLSPAPMKQAEPAGPGARGPRVYARARLTPQDGIPWSKSAKIERPNCGGQKWRQNCGKVCVPEEVKQAEPPTRPTCNPRGQVRIVERHIPQHAIERPGASFCRFLS